jgi:riboflavin synthase
MFSKWIGKIKIFVLKIIMFTGIIEKKGHILDIHQGVFTIENPFSDTEKLVLWQSISHDGACMTITDIGNAWRKTGRPYYSFFTMEESWKQTNFWSKNIGNSFNVERAMIYGQRVDGHMVSGHIDTTAEIYEISKNSDDSRNVNIQLSPEDEKYCIYKGSIAINGVSLTVAEIKQVKGIYLLTVCLIPYTREHTNLSSLNVWDIVNVEFDMAGKYILNSQSLIS